MATTRGPEHSPNLLFPVWRAFKAYWPVFVVLAFAGYRFLDNNPGPMGGMTPDFELPEISPQQGPLMLSSMAGKVRVVDFWATWCGPCKMMTPIYSDLYLKDRDRGLEVVGVALDNPENVSEYVQRFHVPYPVVIGDQKTVEEFGGVRGIPTTFVLDRKGRVVQKHVGYVPEFFLERELEALLTSTKA